MHATKEVYLYRVRLPERDARSRFLAYVAQANALVAKPRFHNTIPVKCTTLVYHMVKRIVGRLHWDYRILLSGYLPRYVYEISGLDTRCSLEQLQALGDVTERARQAGQSLRFSHAIRRGSAPL